MHFDERSSSDGEWSSYQLGSAHFFIHSALKFSKVPARGGCCGSQLGIWKSTCQDNFTVLLSKQWWHSGRSCYWRWIFHPLSSDHLKSWWTNSQVRGAINDAWMASAKRFFLYRNFAPYKHWRTFIVYNGECIEKQCSFVTCLRQWTIEENLTCSFGSPSSFLIFQKMVGRRKKNWEERRTRCSKHSLVKVVFDLIGVLEVPDFCVAW